MKVWTSTICHRCGGQIIVSGKAPKDPAWPLCSCDPRPVKR